VHATIVAKKVIFLEIALNQRSQERLELVVDPRLASDAMKKATWLESVPILIPEEPVVVAADPEEGQEVEVKKKKRG